MDYRVYHAINLFVAHHPWLGRAANDVETVGTVALAAAVFALWLLARPGGDRRWKVASASALAAAGLALLVNRLIAAAWHRARPFQTHASAHVWGSRSVDPSFPSDHASAAFAIAFAVLLFDAAAGALFALAAALIAIGRVVIGAHYPGDVLAGLVVGLASAVLVARALRPVIAFLVGVVERVTDPVVAPIWRRARRI